MHQLHLIRLQSNRSTQLAWQTCLGMDRSASIAPCVAAPRPSSQLSEAQTCSSQLCPLQTVSTALISCCQLQPGHTVQSVTGCNSTHAALRCSQARQQPTYSKVQQVSHSSCCMPQHTLYDTPDNRNRLCCSGCLPGEATPTHIMLQRLPAWGSNAHTQEPAAAAGAQNRHSRTAAAPVNATCTHAATRLRKQPR
jgi:hypothetical protein